MGIPGLGKVLADSVARGELKRSCALSCGLCLMLDGLPCASARRECQIDPRAV